MQLNRTFLAPNKFIVNFFVVFRKTSVKRKRRHHSDSSRLDKSSERVPEFTGTMPRIKVESLSVSSTADEDEDGYGSHSDSTMTDTEEDEDDGITLHLQPGKMQAYFSLGTVQNFL